MTMKRFTGIDSCYCVQVRMSPNVWRKCCFIWDLCAQHVTSKGFTYVVGWCIIHEIKGEAVLNFVSWKKTKPRKSLQTNTDVWVSCLVSIRKTKGCNLPVSGLAQVKMAAFDSNLMPDGFCCCVSSFLEIQSDILRLKRYAKVLSHCLDVLEHVDVRILSFRRQQSEHARYIVSIFVGM